MEVAPPEKLPGEKVQKESLKKNGLLSLVGIVYGLARCKNAFFLAQGKWESPTYF
jgi:hypothetical protein